MFDLTRYIEDIATCDTRLEIFISDLLEAFSSRDEAEFWFVNSLEPCFDMMLDEMFEEEE